MATVIGGNKVRLNDGRVVNAQTGAWYDGQQFWGGTLSNPGQINQQSNQQGAGQQVSQEVVRQTNPQNVDFIQQERVKANQIQSPVRVSLPSSTATQEFVTGLSGQVEQARSAIDQSLTRQQQEIDSQIEGLRAKEQDTLGQVQELVTPFREDLENAERQRLFVNQNFEANQQLVNELDSLLTEGNNLIRQAQDVTGLAAVRNPRIQRAMDDVAARAGVIEAVINARNGQIAVAENMIDRSIGAIAADRADQIAYYETILDLNRRDIINLDKQSQKIAEEQLNLKKMDLARAQESSDYIKSLMINPDTAGLLGSAGVRLTDSVADINAKLTQETYKREVADISNQMSLEGAEVVLGPTGIPGGELRVIKDSRGKKHFYRVRESAGGGTTGGTASERLITRVAESISNQSIQFPDMVVDYANELSLDEIYRAYGQSTMGQQFGRPTEDTREIQLLYQWARGKISESEYRAALGG